MQFQKIYIYVQNMLKFLNEFHRYRSMRTALKLKVTEVKFPKLQNIFTQR